MNFVTRTGVGRVARLRSGLVARARAGLVTRLWTRLAARLRGGPVAGGSGPISRLRNGGLAAGYRGGPIAPLRFHLIARLKIRWVARLGSGGLRAERLRARLWRGSVISLGSGRIARLRAALVIGLWQQIRYADVLALGGLNSSDRLRVQQPGSAISAAYATTRYLEQQKSHESDEQWFAGHRDYPFEVKYRIHR